MNFDGSNIFKTLEGPRKYVHGMHLALGPSFTTPRRMHSVTPMSEIGRPHRVVSHGEGGGFGWQPRDTPTVTAKGTGSGAQGVNPSSVTCSVTLGESLYLSDVFFPQLVKSGRRWYCPHRAVVWIKWVLVTSAQSSTWNIITALYMLTTVFNFFN